jgi:hypothetical protein
MGSLAVLGVLWGTRVSLADPLTRFIAVAATLLGSAILVALPGVALVATVSSRRGFSTPTRFGLLVASSGVAALADFWAWIALPVYGQTVAAALLISSIVVIAAIQPTAVLDDPELRLPLFFGLLVALGYSGPPGGTGRPGGDVPAATACRRRRCGQRRMVRRGMGAGSRLPSSPAGNRYER